jgi:acarbose 7IV-phosphotransferase
VDPVAVCGPINLETSVPVASFPLDVGPRRKVTGIESHVSGVAGNVAMALSALGMPVRLTAITGNDEVGAVIREHLAAMPGMEVVYVDRPRSPQTVVLKAAGGECVVLSDLAGAPSVDLRDALDLRGCSAFVPVAIEANIPALNQAAELAIPVFVDIQVVAAVDDPEKEQFCRAADVLAMSDTAIPCRPGEWLRRMGERYGTPVMVLGMAERGAMLARDSGRRLDHVPVVSGPVRSTVGGGDALWACFVDGYLRGGDPLRCLRRAVAFAGRKVAAQDGGPGYLSAQELDAVMQQQGGK